MNFRSAPPLGKVTTRVKMRSPTGSYEVMAVLDDEVALAVYKMASNNELPPGTISSGTLEVGEHMDFRQAWSHMERAGYRYGDSARSNVELGWNMAHGHYGVPVPRCCVKGTPNGVCTECATLSLGSSMPPPEARSERAVQAWKSVAQKAGISLINGKKFLCLDESMCMELGSAMELMGWVHSEEGDDTPAPEKGVWYVNGWKCRRANEKSVFVDSPEGHSVCLSNYRDMPDENGSNLQYLTMFYDFITSFEPK